MAEPAEEFDLDGEDGELEYGADPNDEPDDQDEGDPDEDEGAAHEPVEEDDEEIVFEGDEPPQDETDLVRHLRKELRDRDRKLAQRAASEPEAEIVVGERPKLADFDWDEERFDEALDQYEQRKEAARLQAQRREQAQQQQQAEWQKVTEAYAAKKAALKYPDKEEAEKRAFSELSEMQQAVIAKVASDPALLVYALGKNPARLSKLASLENPLELAAEIGRMGAQMTTKKRGAAPEPDRPERGSVARLSGDKALNAAMAKAQKNGDFSAVVRLKAGAK